MTLKPPPRPPVWWWIWVGGWLAVVVTILTVGVIDWFSEPR